MHEEISIEDLIKLKKPQRKSIQSLEYNSYETKEYEGYFVKQDFFKNFDSLKIECFKDRKEDGYGYIKSQNNNKDIYYNYLSEIEIVRQYLDFMAHDLVFGSPEWQKKEPIIAEMKYSLGRLQTYFINILLDKKY